MPGLAIYCLLGCGGPISIPNLPRSIIILVLVVQSLKWCPNLCNPMNWSTLYFPVLHYLPQFAQTHVHSVNDAIQPFHPLSFLSPPAFNFARHQGLFKWVCSLVGKVLELQLQHQSFQQIFRIDFFRIDCFYLLVVQGTLKSLLQHHNLKVSILQPSAFIGPRLSRPYMTPRKTIALIIWNCDHS